MRVAYQAPWSLRVSALTVLGTTVLLLEAALVWFLGRLAPGNRMLVSAAAAGLLALLACCALLTVRGYGFDTATLLVYRPLWTTRISLEGLRDVVEDPTALRLTLKGIGNGGLFSILGWRHVDGYGWCRVFATDPKRAVVLDRDGDHFIVTPDRPREFVQEAKRWLVAP